MSKFNLEAAKRGDAIQLQISGTWKDCYFIGVNKKGNLVLVEIDGVVYHKSHESSNLRMKPKKREMWCFPYRSGGSLFISSPQDTKENAKRGAAALAINVVAGSVQMILIDEE